MVNNHEQPGNRMIQVLSSIVRVQLKDNHSLKGKVVKVENKTLNLEVDGQVYSVQGSDIKDLKVLKIPPELRKGKDKSKPNRDSRDAVNVYTNDENLWDTPVNKDLEFDFSGSTAKFNKSSALEEFAINDEIQSSQRLVAHNKVNYENHEMVLPNQKSDEPAIVPSMTKSSPKVSSSATQLYLNNVPVSLASPVQLLEIERLCLDRFKMPPILMIENASRSIAKLMIKMLGGSSRVNSANHNLPPLALILAGNNRSGLRSIATARQLLNHGVNILCFCLTDNDYDDDFKKQLEMFKLCGGKLITSMKELFKQIKNSDTPIELILDGLQGYDTNLSDYEDDADITKLIKWINTQNISTISLDIPSGIDAGSGVSSYFIQSKFIISCGLPVNGLIYSYTNKLVSAGDWAHYLIDIGIPSALFKKGNLKKFGQIVSTGEYTVNLEVK